ncbi:MAG: cell envelope integrity protein TolA, partial [Betaproteobacteria bacterium]|nr:cell envelope integrity protein TolA [Betaproteobacteria bacterium]
REALEALARERASAQQREIDKYKNLISARIRRFIVEPPNLQGNPEVEFDVVVLPGGEVLSVKLRKTSGIAVYDSAVERAIYKAQPLPLPPDASLHKDFRDLNLKFRPEK